MQCQDPVLCGATGNVAPNVCYACRLRKKACDKALPSCGFCSVRNLSCQYDIGAPGRRAYYPGRHFVGLPTDPSTEALARRKPVAGQTIDATHASQTYAPCCPPRIASRKPHDALDDGLTETPSVSFDQIGPEYFRRSREWPLVITTAYYGYLAHEGLQNCRQPHVRILLLCMWLLVHPVFVLDKDGTSTTQTARGLHRELKAMFSQAQSDLCASIPLLQAGLLLVEYEYACLRPKLAYITLATCVAMAKVLGIHNKFVGDWSITSVSCKVATMEETNLAWALSIIERMILVELGPEVAPTFTNVPDPKTPLPLSMQRNQSLAFACQEKSTLEATQSPNVNGYGRQAQALVLLSQVAETMRSAKQDQHVLLSDYLGLNERLNLFLAFLLSQEKPDSLSASVALCIRALLILHHYAITVLRPSGTEAAEEEKQVASRTLDTVCDMLTEVARVFGTKLPDSAPLCCFYNVADSLKHLEEKARLDGSPRLLDNVGLLTRVADEYRRKWNLES